MSRLTTKQRRSRRRGRELASPWRWVHLNAPAVITGIEAPRYSGAPWYSGFDSITWDGTKWTGDLAAFGMVTRGKP